MTLAGRRVAVISHTNRVSGAERVIVTMFRAAGVEACVFSGNQAVVDWFREAGLKAEFVEGFQPFSTQLGFKGRIAFLGSFWRLRRKVADYAPSYYHAMNPVGLLGAVFLRIFGRTRPVVLHCHDYYERRPAGVRLVVRLSSPFVRSVLAVSEDVKASLLKFGFPEGVVFVIHNGTNLEDAGAGEKDGSILICGFFEPWKGLPLALEGIGVASRLYKEATVRAVNVVGGFPDQETESGAHAAAAGITFPVTFHGKVDGAAKFFGRAAVVVHTPILPDPFPTVVIEAMAAGCILVVSPLGGAKEALDTRSGIIVEELTGEAVGAAILKAIEMSKSQNLVEIGTSRARELFSSRAVGERYLNWWTKALCDES